MDSLQATMAPITETLVIDDKEVKIDFPLLKMSDLGKLSENIKCKHKASARKAIEEAKLTGSEKYRALANVDLVMVSRLEVGDYVLTFEGAKEAIVMSLTKSSKTKEEIEAIIDAMDPMQCTDLACLVCRYLVRTPEPVSVPEKNPVSGD